MWLTALWADEKERSAVSAGTGGDVCRRAVELTGEGDTARRALARLIEDRGPGVLPLLRERREDPAIAALFGVPPRRKPGRPEGSRTRDALAYALDTVVSDLGMKPVKLLPALGRDTAADSPDHPWLSACRQRGAALRAGAPSSDPELLLLRFWRSYYKDNPRRLLAELIPYLVHGYAGVNSDNPQQRAQAEARLRKVLPLLLPK